MTRLHAALVTPLTGPLALFGQACAFGLKLWAESAAQLPAPWTEVALTIHDAGNDIQSTIASVLKTNPDVFFGPYGSGPMLHAARASTRVIWNHGGASSRLSRPAFPHVINVLSPASTYFAEVLQAIHTFDPDAKTISLFHSTTGFGRDVAAGAMKTAAALHFELQSTSFEPGNALANVPQVPEGDILLVAGNFADERAVAPLFLARSWQAASFIGAGVEEVLANLGDQREGLLGPAQWIASATPIPDEGPDFDWFLPRYRALTGSDPSYPAVQAFAAGLLFARCLREQGSCDDTAQLAAARQLTCQTLYGAFRLDPLTGLQSGHRVLVVQWQQGLRRVVWPPEQAERPFQQL